MKIIRESIWQFICWSGLWKLNYKRIVLNFQKLDGWKQYELWKYMSTDIKRDLFNNNLPEENGLCFYWCIVLEEEERTILWNSINQDARIALWNVLNNWYRKEIWKNINTFEERMEVWRNLTKEQRVKWLYNIRYDYSDFVNNIDLDDLLNWWRDFNNTWDYREFYNVTWIECLNWDNRIKLWKALNWEERTSLWDCLAGVNFPKCFNNWTYQFELWEHLELDERAELWKHITWDECEPLSHRFVLWHRMKWDERIALWERLSGHDKYDLYINLKSNMQNELKERISEEDKKEIEHRITMAYRKAEVLYANPLYVLY